MPRLALIAAVLVAMLLDFLALSGDQGTRDPLSRAEAEAAAQDSAPGTLPPLDPTARSEGRASASADESAASTPSDSATLAPAGDHFRVLLLDESLDQRASFPVEIDTRIPATLKISLEDFELKVK